MSTVPSTFSWRTVPTQQRQLLPRLFQSDGELLVLSLGLGEVVPCLQEPVLEQLDPAWGVLEPTSEHGDLILESTALCLVVRTLSVRHVSILPGRCHSLPHGF
jgi:hypothetical protein